MVAHVDRKVTNDHLKRNAYVYIRQSTARQVLEHQESTKRQYALKERAKDLGWSSDRVIVIDCDLGLSGASAVDRKGFQRLISEVTMDNAGIVLGLEVSRLARNNSDWYRLLEICGLTNTLILDEDGLYDPCNFNDRLLLGLKGTMSEAELHMLHSRLRGGIMNKARRGELKMSLPTGFVYNSESKVVLDPDKQIRETVKLFFQTFRRVGSAKSVVKRFRKEGILFPRRMRGEAHKNEILWEPLGQARALNILHNPRYTGAFAFGQNRYRKCADGHMSCKKRSREDWHVLIKGAHEGYISWEEYEDNERQLWAWYMARSGGCVQKRPPREGPALLQGLALCGICGKRMTVEYRNRYGRSLEPTYHCKYDKIEKGLKTCQNMLGYEIDKAISKLLMETVTPMALEIALNVQQELQQRFEESDKVRRQQVDRAQYEAALAKRRYMQVDPDNRLVAESLEAEWNGKLNALDKAKQEYERLRRNDRLIVDGQKRKDILALAGDFPRLWQNSNISNRERKRIIRLLIEDVTLIKGKDITINVRFKGGATRTLSIPKPVPYCERIKTKPDVMRQVDRLLDHYAYKEIASVLNKQGFTSGTGKPFTGALIYDIQRNNGLKPRYDRLRAKGLFTQKEIAEQLDVHENDIWVWRKQGLFKAHVYNDKNQCLFEPISDDHPIWDRCKKLKRKRNR